jgi:hypothetical protein
VLALPLIDVFTMAKFPVSVSAKTIREILARLSEGLWTLGVGIEPDGHDPEVDVAFEAPACLFRLPSTCRGTAYRTTVNAETRTVVDVAVSCAIVANADAPDIRGRIANVILEGADADPLERARLNAYASIAAPAPARVPRLIKAAAKLPQGYRNAAARAAVVAVSSKPRLSVQVVRHLEKVQKALDLPIEGLHAALHRVRAEYAETAISPEVVDEIALDAVRREVEGGDASGEPLAEAVKIDPVRLARARQETEAVSKALAEVFAVADDAEEKRAAASKAKPPPASGPFDGLDADHGALLGAVLDVGTMSREDFDARAKDRKLLAVGAIERINDWAFDVFDGPVLEDGDEISVPAHLLDRLKETRCS